MEADGRKRRAEVPLTEAQEREAAEMLLPATLPFKLKQAEGRSVRNTKVSESTRHSARRAPRDAHPCVPSTPLVASPSPLSSA